MENLQLIAESREASNKGAARELRRNGRIPAVLYGEGEPQAVSVDAKMWHSNFRHVSGNAIIELKLGKDTHNVLVKDTQEDVLKNQVKHIDFFAIHAGQKLHAMVPIHFEGSAPGVKEGGILVKKVEALDIVCLPKDMPESFTVDISSLNVNESIHVRDINVPSGVEVRDDADRTVVIVTLAKSEAAPAEDSEDEEAGADE